MRTPATSTLRAAVPTWHKKEPEGLGGGEAEVVKGNKGHYERQQKKRVREAPHALFVVQRRCKDRWDPGFWESGGGGGDRGCLRWSSVSDVYQNLVKLWTGQATPFLLFLFFPLRFLSSGFE